MAQQYPTSEQLGRRVRTGQMTEDQGLAESDRIQANLLKKAIANPDQYANGGVVRDVFGKPSVTNHSNKSYRMANGGVVPDDEEGALSGMVPKSLHKLWGMIPSAADVAVTGKLAATPEEYDKARAAKDAAISRRSK